jgi:hypothetical protein
MRLAGSNSGATWAARRLLAGAGLAAAAAMGVLALLAGCGTPGAPLPPSLKLPDPVTDLTAVRTGDQVALAWTMPRKNTDKLLIKGDIAVVVCRALASGGCDPVGTGVMFAPNAKATFTDALPVALASGVPRPLSYFVELKNARGRTAGPSNLAHVLAGEAPAAVDRLSAELRKDGVVLHWTADAVRGQNTAVRLHRTLVTHESKGEATADKSASKQGFFAPAKEPLEQSLLVDSSSRPGRAIDKTIRFGETYEYRAQRVARVDVGGQTVELAGPLSEPIRVEAIDTFPPEVPSGLAAVASSADAEAGAQGPSAERSIDLSWLPDAEADLAGYAVYRREGDGAWQRISPEQPVVGPAFHDPNVQAGHSYRYAVTAIDKLGHESARSEEATETVPAQ